MQKDTDGELYNQMYTTIKLLKGQIGKDQMELINPLTVYLLLK